VYRFLLLKHAVFLTKAIKHLKSEADWQEILAKVKEEEPLPSYLFKVRTETHEQY
jgi:hypothetical protein